MKYLKSYEAINYQAIIDKFLNDYENWLNAKWLRNKEDVLYKMNSNKFLKEFEYEFSLLYFLYSQSKSFTYTWKTDNKQENDRIKRTVKKYVTELVTKKLDDDIELSSKLQKMYNDQPNWDKPSSRYFGTILDGNIKNIFQVFHTILSKYSDVLARYNL